MIAGIKFANPEYLYLLLIVPLLLIWYIFRQMRYQSALHLSSLSGFSKAKPSIRQMARHILIVLRILTFSLLVVALARPQSSSTKETVTTEGIDIVVALDVSTSMLAEDFKPNRIDAAKKYAMQFIESRVDDRIGLVIFSGESFTQCPVTIDHDVLKNMFQSIQSGMIEDGTAIGMGLATSISRLKDSKAKSRIIILLTDGVNNMGSIAPLTAADIAKSYNIRVYTVGIGTRGMAPYPFKTPFGTQYRNVEVQIDEDVLKQISKQTDGKYFRATSNKALEEIYKEIDKMEKTKVDVAYYKKYQEKYFQLALAALCLVVLELLFRYTIFKTLP